jgi:hypothetical protein
VAGRAGAWRATRLSAIAHADTNGLDGAGLPTPSGRAVGDNGAGPTVAVVGLPMASSRT